jgi:hypothetical protein
MKTVTTAARKLANCVLPTVVCGYVSTAATDIYLRCGTCQLRQTTRRNYQLLEGRNRFLAPANLMPDHPIFTLQSPRDQRTNGDVVSGVVNLDLARALEKDVEKVRVSLRGEIHT